LTAIALNSAGFNIARAVGPAIAGLILVAANAGVVFLIDALSFVGVIIVLYRWHRKPLFQSALPAE
jgi:predicted MFS family arabinose efflux permease